MTPPPLAPESRTNRIVIGSIVMLMLLLCIGLGVVMKHEPDTRRTWRIAIAGWPGYDPLYLASRKGFLTQQGLDIELLPINSFTDMRRAFERGIIDGYTGTLIDTVESIQENHTPNRIVMLTDYSNGGDQLLADPSITTVAQLKGKKLSLEITSPVARYLLERALQGSGISSTDIDLRPYSQTILADQAIRGNLDAIITYEPFTSNIQSQRNMPALFTSADIPGEILQVLITSPHMLEAEPELSRRLQLAWQAALDYAVAHPDETNRIYAENYGVDVATYKKMAAGSQHLSRAEMQRYTSSHDLHRSIQQISTMLNPSQPLAPADISSSIHIWFQQEAR